MIGFAIKNDLTQICQRVYLIFMVFFLFLLQISRGNGWCIITLYHSQKRLKLKRNQFWWNRSFEIAHFVTIFAHKSKEFIQRKKVIAQTWIEFQCFFLFSLKKHTRSDAETFKQNSVLGISAAICWMTENKRRNTFGQKKYREIWSGVH